jgi:hypothetical protein
MSRRRLIATIHAAFELKGFTQTRSGFTPDRIGFHPRQDRVSPQGNVFMNVVEKNPF